MSSNTQITLEPMQDEDQEVLVRIFEESRFDLLMIDDPEMKKQIIEHQYQIESNQLMRQYIHLEQNCIKYENKTVGRLFINRMEKEYRIVEFGILESHRRLGIGKRVIDLVKERARKEEKSISLQVAWFNQGAKAFYECQGFEMVSDENVFFEMRFN